MHRIANTIWLGFDRSPIGVIKIKWVPDDGASGRGVELTMTGNADIEILQALNRFFVLNDHEGKFILGIAGNPLFRGFPIFFSLAALWFSVDGNARRSRMLLGLLAACLATLLSVWVQHHFTPHVRPVLDPATRIRIFDPKGLLEWYRKGSFPSDTATLYFSLVAIIFLEKRLVGILCFVWAFLTVGVARVALGLHYPSDVLGALVLGPGLVWLFESIPQLRTLSERALGLFQTRPYIVHALVIVFLAEAYNLLLGLQGILTGLSEIGALLSAALTSRS